MKTPLLYSYKKFSALLSFAFIFMFLNMFQNLNAQTQVYADAVVSQNNVLNSNNAIAENGSFATLNSSGGLLAGGGAYTGEIELEFSSTIPANTTTFVRIDFDNDLLNVLLGGALGDLLADTVGTIALGDHFFNVEARDNATTVLSASSATGATDRFRVVVDRNGYFYIAITPDADYNRVYIEDATSTLLLGQENSMNVHHAFFYNDLGNNVTPLYTDFDESGLGLDVADLADSGVVNPQFAIDNNNSSFSEISLGTVSLGAGIQQNIYFAREYTNTDEFSITLKTEPALAAVGIQNNVVITAFNDGAEVFSTTLGDVLNIDLLGLFESGEIVTVPFAPNITFDAVSISLSSLQPVGATQSINIYGISIAGELLPGEVDNRVFADTVSNENNATNSGSAVGDNGNFAVLESFGGIAVGIGSYTGDIELQYPEVVPANTTSYIRIDFDDDVLNSLLGGSLGDLLADIVGTIALGDHFFNVEARNNTTTVLSESSSDLSTDRFRVVVDEFGFFYIAITPDSDYDRVYIEDVTNALLLGETNTMNVHHAFYYSSTTPCATNNLFTDFDDSGIGLDLLELQNSGVTNPQFAIDENDSNFSQLSLGVVSVGAGIQQNIYFSKDYSPQSEISVRLKTDPSLLTVGLVNNVVISALDDGTEVFSTTLSSGLDVDLLGLLSDGEIVDVTFAPNLTFDTVTVSLTSLEVVTVAQSLDLYGVSIIDTSIPDADAEQTFCLLDDPTVADLEVNSGQNIIWYDAPVGGTAYSTTDPLIDGEVYYASQTIDGCESTLRADVTVTVNDTATPTTTEPNQEFCIQDNPTVADLQVNETGVTWYDMATGGTAFNSTDALIDGQSYFGALTVDGCDSTTRLEVIVTIANTPPPTTTEPNQEFCIQDNPTIADIQVNETGVIWYDMATGGTAYDSTDALTNGQTYYASQILNNCESASRLAVVVTIFETPTPTTDNTEQEFCSQDVPTIADLMVNEADVTWYDMATGGTAYDPTDELVNGQSYFASILADNCESATRLEVVATINTTPPPTTDDIAQEFCIQDNPTVSDIDVNEPGIVWYDMETGGTALPVDEPLVDGVTYYASQTINNCDSTSRLAVQVEVIETPTPTTDNTDQEFCIQDNATIADLQVNESNVTWFDMATGGTAYDPTDGLVDGQSYYASIVADNCESASRLEVSVSIFETQTPTTNEAIQEFCSQDNPTIADLQVNEPNITWYDMATGGTAYNATDALVDGQTYFASQLSNNCESATRLEVTATIYSTPPPTTTDSTQDFCTQDSPTVGDIQVNEPNVTWYDMATGGNAFSNTASLINGQTYYGSIIENDCESVTRLAVTVTINDTQAPTTVDSTQDFCIQDNPTIADLQVIGTAVIWYDMPTGGTAFNSTDTLDDNTIYYATQTQNGCESEDRLAVSVSIFNTPPPTTTNSTQEFCISNNPTVADLQVNESNVIWYDAPTNGTAFSNTASLINGQVYYGSQTLNGCESVSRLAVTVIIRNTAPPTTLNNMQEFCIQDNPTIADLQVNESDVIWYDMSSGGTILSPSEPLISGQTYYGAQNINGCESNTRLAIGVTIFNTPPPTTANDTQTFCAANNPTVGDIQVNELNITWYNSAAGTTPLNDSDALVDGQVYYASQTLNGCESVTRLAVTTNITNTPPPTTVNANQEFCEVNNPTIADIEINETNITWYDMPTGGTAYNLTDALTDGFTYYASQTVDGCESSTRLEVNVSIFSSDSATITSSASGDVCLNTVITYTTEPGNTNYMWDFTGGMVVAGGGLDDNTIEILWDTQDNTTVSVSYDAANACSSGGPVTINEIVSVCGDLAITKTVDETSPTIGSEVTFVINVTHSGPNDFFDITIDEVLPSGYELISSNATVGTYTSAIGEWFIPTLMTNQTASLTITAEVLGDGDYLNISTIESSTPEDTNPSNNSAEASVDPLCLFVYSQFSPNGDGMNENFTISCIERFPNNEIQIFNRYGSLVYKKVGYRNDWDGTANVSSVSSNGELLPAGTYYYVIKMNDQEDNRMSGWVYLIK